MSFSSVATKTSRRPSGESAIELPNVAPSGTRTSNWTTGAGARGARARSASAPAAAAHAAAIAQGSQEERDFLLPLSTLVTSLRPEVGLVDAG